MMRFIDLGKQIGGDDEEWLREFTFFNTVPDRFIDLDGDQVWTSISEFKASFKRSNCPHDLRRFLDLIPDWVPE